MDSEEKLNLIREAMEEMKGLEINAMDVQAKTQLTDYLIVCSGTSNIHIRAIADRILETLKQHGAEGIRREGYSEARWIVMDCGDVVAHVFDPEDRLFYRLEEYWEREKPLLAA